MHTVRRAYSELADRGLVEIQGPRGTHVLGKVIKSGSVHSKKIDPLDDYIQRILQEGHTQHGLSRHDLIQLLEKWSPPQAGIINVVHVVECSETQCNDHVREIEQRWEIEARPWCLSRSGEPPAGPIVATYFHYNEIRRRWPHRLHEIRFAAIHPDPQLSMDHRTIPASGKRMTMMLCEFDEPMARNIAADLSVIFPTERYQIKTCVTTPGAEVLESSGNSKPVLFSPRVWDSLEPHQREDPRAVKIVYVFTEEELENLGSYFGWYRRRQMRQHG